MRERVRLFAFLDIEVVVQIVHVHCAVAEAPAGRDVEIANDFVHAEAAFDPASLAALRIEFLGVVLAFALFDIFAAAEGPGYGCVGFPHFFAGVAAVLF